MKVQERVNGVPNTIPRRPPLDPDFRAEVSFIKSKEESYGEPGTKRIDALEKVKTSNTVCVHDLKTGVSRLSFKRMLELASSVAYFYPGTDRIVVTETRPQR
jgi:hypothetical protein